jgi:hypothetical protein
MRPFPQTFASANDHFDLISLPIARIYFSRAIPFSQVLPRRIFRHLVTFTTGPRTDGPSALKSEKLFTDLPSSWDAFADVGIHRPTDANVPFAPIALIHLPGKPPIFGTSHLAHSPLSPSLPRQLISRSIRTIVCTSKHSRR